MGPKHCNVHKGTLRNINTITHVLSLFRREKFAEFVPEVFSLESGEYLNESVIVDTVRNGSINSALFAFHFISVKLI